MHSSKNGDSSSTDKAETSASKSEDIEEKDKAEATELEKYWQVVKTNPGDFTGWTYLLQFVEQENDLPAAREAFDTFFTYYPYCYGYWKKYADMEKKLDAIEKAEEVFERGVAAIPLSVDLWIHYINFVKTHFKDEDYYYVKVKNLFERAIDASGQDFRSDRLWDMYVTWEQENKNHKEVTSIYDRILVIPTQLYGHHFEKFQEHVKGHSPKEILSTDEFLQIRQHYMEANSKVEQTHEEDPDDGGYAPPPGVEADLDDAPPGVEEKDENLENKSVNDKEAKFIKEKVIEKRKTVFKANEEEVGRRWAFEEGIKRPYFHVKPLERAQLKNWREYLDFEVQNGTHSRVVILFERCLIACALYEDMWMKYIKYMEGAEPDKVAEVYKRACTIHLPRKPNINLAWATYEEKRGRFDEACSILLGLETRIPNFLEAVLRRINVERRRGNYAKVEELYRSCISQAKNPRMACHFAVKLARFLYKVQENVDAAVTVIKEAISNDKNSPQLYMQLVDIGYQKTPPDEKLILESFDLAIASDIPHDEKLMFLQRKLEYLEDFGKDCSRIQETYDEYSKLFKIQMVTKKRPAESEETEVAQKKAKTELNGAEVASSSSPSQASAASTASSDPSAQYNYASSWAGYPQTAYGYQQPWSTYPASYYPTH